MYFYPDPECAIPIHSKFTGEKKEEKCKNLNAQLSLFQTGDIESEPQLNYEKLPRNKKWRTRIQTQRNWPLSGSRSGLVFRCRFMDVKPKPELKTPVAKENRKLEVKSKTESKL